MKKLQQTFKPILSLVIAWFIAHYIEFFSHEYSHSAIAWMTAFKQNTFDIIYGHPTLSNILFNQQMDENVNYLDMFLSGHRDLIALAAFAGLLSNILWYLISLILVQNQKIQTYKFVFRILIFLNMMAILNFISYIPCRTFTGHADVANFGFGLNINPGWASIATIPIAVSVYIFFSKTIPLANQVLEHNYFTKVFMLLASGGTI